MKDRKVFKLILITLFAAVLIVGSSYAYWVWESQQNTNVSFNVTKGFSCSADGGGNITSNDVILEPASCTDTEHAIVREINVDVQNSTGRPINLELWLNVNTLDVALTESDNFKWAIGTNPSSCTSGIINSGNFYYKNAGDKVYLTSIYDTWNVSSQTYYLYIWLDINETSTETINNTVDLSLAGECLEGYMPNEPFITDTGLIPVKISASGNEVYAISESNPDWYDYANRKWANAVLTTSTNRSTYQSVTGNSEVQIPSEEILAYYVWIPRYSYKTWQSTGTNPKREIDIKFVSKNVKEENTGTGNWYTHPAFTFGNTEVSGIWVGKFETSHDTLSGSSTDNNLNCTNSNCFTYTGLRVLPNVVALTKNNVSNFFYASLKMNENGNPFGLNNVAINSHMTKNSEWGAVAYLSHSRYGKNGEIEPNTYQRNSNMTGCGSPALYDCINQYGTVTTGIYPQSTTGDVTGVFDMSGGMSEYLMANYNDSVSSSGFTVMPKKKYYDSYANPPFDSTNDATNLSKCTLSTCGGHALNETRAWYSDYSSFFRTTDSNYAWLLRGRHYSYSARPGIFVMNISTGTSSNEGTFRSVLIENISTDK